jgi:protein-disulfide isomerase-like protein with CxxC motif
VNALPLLLLLLLFLLQIDGMKNRVLMKRFGVTGFPSLYLLRNGQTWQYTGQRGVADVSGNVL